MKLGALLMPSHPPERSIRDGQCCDLGQIERLDSLGFEEAWIAIAVPQPHTASHNFSVGAAATAVNTAVSPQFGA